MIFMKDKITRSDALSLVILVIAVVSWSYFTLNQYAWLNR